MKKFYLILIVLFYLLPTSNVLAQTSAGFVPGDIWYSKDPFEEGDKIKIYTVIFNPDTREFSGSVVFFDGSTFLGKKDFTLPGRSVKDYSIDWTATAGDHKIFAKIQNAKFLVSPGKYQDVYLSDDETNKNSRTVSKKIITENQTDKTNNLLTTSLETLSDTRDKITDSVPDVVTDSLDSSKNSLEGLREKISDYSLNIKDTTKDEIAELKKPEGKKDGEDTGSLVKPFKYIKLFFANLLYFVFHNKIVFYGLLVGITFYLLRYIWRLIF